MKNVNKLKVNDSGMIVGGQKGARAQLSSSVIHCRAPFYYLRTNEREISYTCALGSRAVVQGAAELINNLADKSGHESTFTWSYIVTFQQKQRSWCIKFIQPRRVSKSIQETHTHHF